MTPYRTTAIALTAIMAAAVAGAHNGATGVVRERMEGMVAMRDAMRDLTPMMRGEAPQDEAAVAAAGRTIAKHAGEAMIALFPEGSGGGASFAKEAVWAAPDDFSALADELRRHAEGLVGAASNPTAPMTDAHAGMDMGGQTGMDMGEHAGMDMSGATEPPTGPGALYSVAQLMGFEPRTSTTSPSKAQPVAGLDPVSMKSNAPDYGSMAASDVFRMIGETCSACHGRFRSGS
ncbi:cytochrome c [Limimaricola sp. G21655-S1]|uniref:c-type cytochrome n=1 Tax=Limimaricola sp. G21655-S1 TaxID=3014768 RepID=UPI0022AE84AD|nr:cytochrome c [Limimaricola sp. G21655-S1]MCZ4260076.1 cytochrome c [Limimaricola sp. G21655-S1]